MAKQRDVVVRFLADTKGLNAVLSESENKLLSFSKKVQLSEASIGNMTKTMAKVPNAASLAGNAINDMGSKVMGLSNGIPIIGNLLQSIANINPVTKGVVAGIALMTGAIVGMVSAGSQAETQLTSMSVLLKQQGQTMSDTKRFYREMMDLAAETPLRTNDVVEASKRLLAVGIPKSQIKSDLVDIGNVAAGSGKNFIELIDIMAKNKTQGIIQGEDLRQMVSAGIPIMTEFTRMTGKTAQEIKKMGEQGTLTYDMMAKAMHNMASAGGIYEDMMVKQSRTVSGLWSTIQDDVMSTFRSMSGILADENDITFWSRFKDIMVDVASFTKKFFNENAARFQEIGTIIGNALAIVWQIGKTIFEIFKTPLQVMGAILGFAIDIGLAISKWSGSAIISTLRVIASLFSNIWDMATNIAGFFYRITGAASAIGYLIDKIQLFVTAIKFDISLAGLYIQTIVAEWSKAIDDFLDKHKTLKVLVDIATGGNVGKDIEDLKKENKASNDAIRNQSTISNLESKRKYQPLTENENKSLNEAYKIEAARKQTILDEERKRDEYNRARSARTLSEEKSQGMFSKSGLSPERERVLESEISELRKIVAQGRSGSTYNQVTQFFNTHKEDKQDILNNSGAGMQKVLQSWGFSY